MRVEKLDRILDRDDVELFLAIDLVHHRGERRRLSRAGRTRDENEAAGLVAEELDDRRQAELAESLDLVGDLTVDAAHRAPLHEVVRAEAREALDTEGKVELQVLLEAVLLGIGQDRVSDLLRLGHRQRRIREREQPPVEPHHRRRVGGQMEVGCAHFDHLFQELMKSGFPCHFLTALFE